MCFIGRMTQTVLVIGFFFGFASAAEASRDDLKAALADLTTNIDGVDDSGFEKAGRILASALSDVTASRLQYGGLLGLGRAAGPTI